MWELLLSGLTSLGSSVFWLSWLKQRSLIRYLKHLPAPPQNPGEQTSLYGWHGGSELYGPNFKCHGLHGGNTCRRWHLKLGMMPSAYGMLALGEDCVAQGSYQRTIVVLAF